MYALGFILLHPFLATNNHTIIIIITTKYVKIIRSAVENYVINNNE